MSLDGRIRELSRRHLALETELRDAILHPSSQDEDIREIKRRKLRLKEELERLRAGNRSAA
jgi:hypothetical protein